MGQELALYALKVFQKFFRNIITDNKNCSTFAPEKRTADANAKKLLGGAEFSIRRKR